MTEKQHVVQRNLSSLSALGLPVDFNAELSLSFNHKVYEKVLRQQRSLSLSKRYCCIHPMSRKQKKLWLRSEWVKLATALHKRGMTVVFMSGPDPEEQQYV